MTLDTAVKYYFISGNSAALIGLVHAGGRFYPGYPITPAGELLQEAAMLVPALRGSFIQAESEETAINMLYGAAASGRRVFTATAPPGISRMAEGISYAVAAELPMVIVNVSRNGPGLGHIWTQQSDVRFLQAPGHGVRLPVFSPANGQEIYDLAVQSMDVAVEERTPVVLAIDAALGQTFWQVELQQALEVDLAEADGWRIGRDTKDPRVITTIPRTPDELEERFYALSKKWDGWGRFAQAAYTGPDDPDMLVVAYGTMANITKSALEHYDGKVALLDLKTLFPFPKQELRELLDHVRVIAVPELSPDHQLIELIEQVTGEYIPVESNRRSGGNIQSEADLRAFLDRAWTRRLDKPLGSPRYRVRDLSPEIGPPKDEDTILKPEKPGKRPKNLPRSMRNVASIYCPGCGHETIELALGRAMDILIAEGHLPPINVSSIGCSVWHYERYIEGIGAAHGEAAPVASALKAMLPHRIIYTYQGDGDFASIGLGASLHALRRNEPITVIFVNNANYGMTGHQLAPTSWLGLPTSTTPQGSDVPPLDVSRMLSAQHNLPNLGYVVRVAANKPKEVEAAIETAFRYQLAGMHSVVEVLSQCPQVAQGSTKAFMAELESHYPVRVYRQSGLPANDISRFDPMMNPDDIAGVVHDMYGEYAFAENGDIECMDREIIVAGSGGQGVRKLGLSIGRTAAELGNSVAFPSYGAEQRGGTSNVYVKMSSRPIANPRVEVPQILVALNAESLARFGSVTADMILYNGPELDQAAYPAKIEALDAKGIATEICPSRPPENLVMYGALLALTDIFPKEIAWQGLPDKWRVIGTNREAFDAGYSVAK